MTGMRLKPFDFAALALAAAVVGAVAVAYDTDDLSNLVVAVEGARNAWLFPVDTEETVVVPGPLGDTVVNIENGSAYVVSSPCANQLCVAQGKIHRPGNLVSCLPNRVVVTIQGKRNTVDGGTW
jgi:hypothetical protein